MALLQGPVVFVDDELQDPTKPAAQLAAQIRATGRPLAEYTELPPQEHSEHWRSIAFLVLDWDLVPTSPGVSGGSTLSEFARQSLFDWLSTFVEQIYCPVFVVSAEDTDDITKQLREIDTFATALDRGRIAVFSKIDIMDNFIAYMEKWVSESAALSALNVWANEFERATDRLFHDLEELEPDWPAYVWKTAADDGVDPSFELASVLSANLLHRIDPLHFDVPAISDYQGQPTPAALRRVSYGRTTLPGERLYDSMVLPGDIFQDGEDEGCIWVNVTPACHTVLNRPAKGQEKPSPEKVPLHLVKGTRQERPTSKGEFSRLKQLDGPNGVVIHTLLGDDPYAIDFKARRIATWGEVATSRIARLLPPYITLMQQRHAGFLMNEGLPSVDISLYQDTVEP